MIPALAQGLRIWCGLKLQLRSQTRLWIQRCCGCGIGQRLQFQFNAQSSLGTFICHRCHLKKKKKIFPDVSDLQPQSKGSGLESVPTLNSSSALPLQLLSHLVRKGPRCCSQHLLGPLLTVQGTPLGPLPWFSSRALHIEGLHKVGLH